MSDEKKSEKRTIVEEIEVGASSEAVCKALADGTERAGRIRCGLRPGVCDRGGLSL
jgi:hypothetical protein